MHEQAIIGANCVKHTSNDRNMLQLSKHGNPQILVLIGIQTNAKMPKGHFIKHLACMNKPYMIKDART